MHMNMGYSDVRRLPTRYRAWFIKRLSDYFEKKNDSSGNMPQADSSDTKSLSDYQEMLDKKFK